MLKQPEADAAQKRGDVVFSGKCNSNVKTQFVALDKVAIKTAGMVLRIFIWLARSYFSSNENPE